ncbi:hypothetical protein BD626DRAFT_224658 [Schizophyllum amplum]|uniref:Uncharacterized protein n=1 Tax=Schizophyllum amplum TaxID=97359 RepID=A0A550BX84_9AGAR|nr:hypothetical protein BD626DRAFT_224658 [Auriculariopsis ampla]
MFGQADLMQIGRSPHPLINACDVQFQASSAGVSCTNGRRGHQSSVVEIAMAGRPGSTRRVRTSTPVPRDVSAVVYVRGPARRLRRCLPTLPHDSIARTPIQVRGRVRRETSRTRTSSPKATSQGPFVQGEMREATQSQCSLHTQVRRVSDSSIGRANPNPQHRRWL